MRITITGATGFVGKNLEHYLSSISSDIVTPSLRNWTPKLQSDFDTDAIIHLAGKAHDLRNSQSYQEYFDINYELTKKVYDHFLKSRARVFVFMSSVKASADDVLGKLTECDVPNPVTHYGQSKLMAEKYITSQDLPDGKFCYILRPSMIHGPGNKGNLNLLFKVVKSGLPYPLTSFVNARSFLSIENLCFIIKELIVRNDIPSGIYNVADDDPLSTNEVVNIFSDILKRKNKMLYISPKFVKLIARFGDILKLPFDTEKLKKLTDSYIVDTSKLKGALNKPLPITSKTGLLKTACFFQNDLTT